MLLNERAYEVAYTKMRDSSKDRNIEYQDKYCLAEISNFNKLIALSNTKSIPVFEVELDSQLAHKGQVRTLNWFKFLYKALATRILELTCDEW